MSFYISVIKVEFRASALIYNSSFDHKYDSSLSITYAKNLDTGEFLIMKVGHVKVYRIRAGICKSIISNSDNLRRKLIWSEFRLRVIS